MNEKQIREKGIALGELGIGLRRREGTALSFSFGQAEDTGGSNSLSWPNGSVIFLCSMSCLDGIARPRM